jgi:hypothetical protein
MILQPVIFNLCIVLPYHPQCVLALEVQGQMLSEVKLTVLLVRLLVALFVMLSMLWLVPWILWEGDVALVVLGMMLMTVHPHFESNRWIRHVVT